MKAQIPYVGIGGMVAALLAHPGVSGVESAEKGIEHGHAGNSDDDACIVPSSFVRLECPSTDGGEWQQGARNGSPGPA